MSPRMIGEFDEKQLAFIRDLHAQLMASELLEHPSKAYALKGLLCELTKPEYMAYDYLLEKLNLLFPVEFQIKREDDE